MEKVKSLNKKPNWGKHAKKIVSMMCYEHYISKVLKEGLCNAQYYLLSIRTEGIIMVLKEAKKTPEQASFLITIPVW